MDELHERVANRIKELAEQKGLPLSHVADRAAISRTHLFDVLGGRKSPTLTLLGKVAEALEVDASELVPRHAKTKK